MTFGQVDVSYSLPKGRAVKLTFFAPCGMTQTGYLIHGKLTNSETKVP